MISTIKKVAVLACLTVGLSTGLSSSVFAVAPDFMEKLQADSRPTADKIRDGARRPAQVMNLLGVEEGMTAIDIGAGGGWYTRVLSAAVGQSGHVISQAGPRGLQRNNGQAAKDLAAGLGNTEASFENLGDIGSNVADVAVTALNVHHADEARGTAVMKDIFTVLKSGGVAAIIDHVGLPTENNAALHRIVPADVKAWIEAAGLEIVVESDLLYTNADDHTLGIRDPSLGRNVDRFLFVVRKP